MNDEVWYDLELLGGELMVVAGPKGWKVADIDPDALPDGFRWVTGEEWEEQCDTMEIRDV